MTADKFRRYFTTVKKSPVNEQAPSGSRCENCHSVSEYERRKVYHRAYYSLDAYSWLENYALEHSRSPEDILLEREEMTTRLYLIAALPVALAHATPTQARCVHAYYIAGIKQPEISRIEGVHSSKVSVAIRRGLRNMRRCYDGLFQTE